MHAGCHSRLTVSFTLADQAPAAWPGIESRSRSIPQGIVCPEAVLKHPPILIMWVIWMEPLAGVHLWWVLDVVQTQS